MLSVLFPLLFLSILSFTNSFNQRIPPQLINLAAQRTSARNQMINLSDDSEKTPIALVVSVEIKEDRLDEFLKVIEADAIGSRTKENGNCLRFDVLQDKTNKCKFQFYEVYTSEDAIIYHKSTDHFKLWTDFKASGGVVSQTAIKSDAIFYTN